MWIILMSKHLQQRGHSDEQPLPFHRSCDRACPDGPVGFHRPSPPCDRPPHPDRHPDQARPGGAQRRPQPRAVTQACAREHPDRKDVPMNAATPQPGVAILGTGEMGTAGPDLVADLAKEVAAAGARLVDAPILGAPPIVLDGEAAILISGAMRDVAAATPVLAPLGTVRHVGTLGKAARLKLVAN